MVDKKPYRGERMIAILDYLASIYPRCATLDEIMEAIRDINRNCKTRKTKIEATVHTIGALVKRYKVVKRKWGKRFGHRKRLYCYNPSRWEKQRSR